MPEPDHELESLASSNIQLKLVERQPEQCAAGVAKPNPDNELVSLADFESSNED